MRKAILLLTILPGIAFAQTNLQVKGSNTSVSTSQVTQGDLGNNSIVRVSNGVPPVTQQSGDKEWLFTPVVIGETQYDLQVNSALANRVIRYEDGKISVTYTMAQDGDPWLTRGTGYAHFDGSKWSDIALNRLEDGRAGWNNLGVWDDNGTKREVVVSHFADNVATNKTGGLFIMMNDKVGSDNFQIIEKYHVADNTGPFWPRMTIMGDYMHIFAAFNTQAKNNVIDSIKDPNTYYRYDLKNKTWLDEQVLLPGYDKSRIARGSNDSYIFDNNGSALALVSGGSGQDLMLWKSTDNGDTWVATVVDSFKVAKFDGNTAYPEDTMETNTGSIAVLLDKNNNAHVWWTGNRILDDVDGDSNWSFFPGVNRILYWNEYTMDAKVVAATPDIDNSNTLDISSTNYSGAAETNVRYVGNTLACYPTAAIGPDGTIYMAFSAMNETALSVEGFLFRDIMIVYSKDNGTTWSDVQNLIEGKETEDVFGYLARNADDKLHIVWQRDNFAGTTVLNKTTASINKIMYAAIPTSLVTGNDLKFNRTSVNELPNNSFSVTNLFPNPATNSTNFNIEMKKVEAVSIKITSMLGQDVLVHSFGSLSGQQQLSVNTSSLAKGVYLYTIQSGEGSSTGRLVIE